MAQNFFKKRNFIFFARFCLLCPFCAFLVLCYNEVIFRPFNSSSFDMQTDNVLSAVRQLSAWKDTLSYHLRCKMFKFTNISDYPTLKKIDF